MAGDQDPDTLHLGIFANDDLVGIVSLMKASIPSVGNGILATFYIRLDLLDLK